MTCEACKTIPPVVAEGYEPKGKWEEIAGLKTCMFLPSASPHPLALPLPCIAGVLLVLICK